jgi:predicted MFS family arabinose efflux permease
MGPIALLRNGDFRRVWITGAIGGTVRWLETLAVGVFVFDMTGSPFTVAFMLFARLAPTVLFGALVGTLAERINRKTLLTCGLVSNALVSTALATLAHAGVIELWHIALGAFLNGIVWTGEFPVRRTILGEIAGPERVGNGMALDSATFNASRMVGPTLGGFLFEAVGLQGAYFAGAALYALAAVLIGGMAFVPAPGTRDAGFFSNLRDGLRHVRARRVIVGVLVVTMIMNFFGFAYTGMVPVIGREHMQLSALLIGILMSAEGGGALIGAVSASFLAKATHSRRIFLSGAFMFLIAIMFFPHSGWFAVTFCVLFVSGLGLAGFGSMQSMLVYTSAAPELRARAMGLLAVCIGMGPLGVLHVGLLAGWLGAPAAVTVIAMEGLIALLVAVTLWPELRHRHT